MLYAILTIVPPTSNQPIIEVKWLGLCCLFFIIYDTFIISISIAGRSVTYLKTGMSLCQADRLLAINAKLPMHVPTMSFCQASPTSIPSALKCSLS